MSDSESNRNLEGLSETPSMEKNLSKKFQKNMNRTQDDSIENIQKQ